MKRPTVSAPRFPLSIEREESIRRFEEEAKANRPIACGHGRPLNADEQVGDWGNADDHADD